MDTRTNIDTYANNNLANNIDTFFNTALFDNEFMYGKSGYGMNPYLPFQNYNRAYGNNSANTINSIDTNYNTKDMNNNQNRHHLFAKNIDTYKTDGSTPKQKISNFKNRLKNFINPKK